MVRPLLPLFRPIFALLAACALIVSACTGGDSESTPRPQILTPTAGPLDGEPASTPEPEGIRVDDNEIEVGTCFNRYEFYFEQIDDTQEVTTEVDCRRPHDGEVYAFYDHPAEADAPYPGSTQLQEWSNIQCLGSFEDFVGTAFVLSELHIGTIRPNAEEWTGDANPDAGPRRRIRCYVFAPNAQLSGPMAGSGF